jgi:dTDP-4-dehydrorhamnose 3,5-epimerase
MNKEYPLPGIKTNDINILPDERGFFAEILRNDYKDFIDEWPVQVNLSYSFPGIVRAWHRHDMGQVDYFIALKGAAKICAYNENTKSLVEIINNANKPSITRVPGHYLHGFKAISDEPLLIIYFVNRIYNRTNPDEVRRPWNDRGIVPLEINGDNNDPRVGKPWDWFFPPYK